MFCYNFYGTVFCFVSSECSFHKREHYKQWKFIAQNDKKFGYEVLENRVKEKIELKLILPVGEG